MCHNEIEGRRGSGVSLSILKGFATQREKQTTLFDVRPRTKQKHQFLTPFKKLTGQDSGRTLQKKKKTVDGTQTLSADLFSLGRATQYDEDLMCSACSTEGTDQKPGSRTGECCRDNQPEYVRTQKGPMKYATRENEKRQQAAKPHDLICLHTRHTYLLNTGSSSVMTPCDRSSAWTLRVAPEKTTSAPLVRSTILSIKKHDRAAVASTPTCVRNECAPFRPVSGGWPLGQNDTAVGHQRWP